MASKNRYKFHFGEKKLTLTTDKDNLFMEEVERVAHEKYNIIKEQMKKADNETIAILMAINSLSTQLEREIQVEDMEKELEILRAKQLEQLKGKATAKRNGTTHDWASCLSHCSLEFLHWLPSWSLYASLLCGFSHYRHGCGCLFLSTARRGY